MKVTILKVGLKKQVVRNVFELILFLFEFIFVLNYPVVTDALIVIFRVFIQPDLSQTNVVAFEDVDTGAPLVR